MRSGFQKCKKWDPPGSSFACGGSVELRAWLCAFVRASDALRCVPARRVLKLSRINGFHLYDLLHAQQFLLVREFEKIQKRKVRYTSSRNCQEFRHKTLRAAPLDCATEQSRDGFSEGKANARKWSNCPRESFATEPLRTSTRAHNCTNGGAGPAENALNKNPPRRRIRKTSSLLLVRTATRSAPRRQKRARPSSEQHKKT